MRPALLLAPLLLLGAAALAEDEAPLDLGAARVLASPGYPKALERFLPPGRRVEPLVHPLPDGPLLVLGLPRTDPVAQGLIRELDLPGVHGGWSVCARRDRGRTLVVFLGADPAALYAARFELETVAPDRVEDPDMALKGDRPLAEATVVVRPGIRRHRPRFLVRALDVRGHACDECILAMGSHANEVWLEADAPDLADRCARLRERGIEPVAVLPAAGNLDALAAAQRDAGVRSFGLDFEASPNAPTTVVAAARIRLRPGGLRRLTVLPRPDREPRYSGRDMPELRVTWRGPPGSPKAVSYEEASRRAVDARVFVLFYESATAPVDLTRATAIWGLVVRGGEDAAAILESAWEPR